MRNQDISKAMTGYKKMCAKRIENYNLNPNLCMYCKKPIPYEKKVARNKFCNSSCAASYTNAQYMKKNGHGKRIGEHSCKFCGKTTNGKRQYCNDKCKVMHKNRTFIFDIRAKIQSGKKVTRETVRKYLLLTREYMCTVCGGTMWLDEPIPLETHHIDGNYMNNLDENITLVCLNCHSLTDTYRGKNRGNGRGEYKRKSE